MCVLSNNPINLTLRDDPWPMRPASYPDVDFRTVVETAKPKEKFSWNNAPLLVEEWVGREDLLEAINNDWINSQKKVTGLIGFGGEGKSSLARRWIDNLMKEESSSKPENIFWWGFYENPSADEFFEAAVNYISVE